MEPTKNVVSGATIVGESYATPTHADLTPLATHQLERLVRVGETQLASIKTAYHTGKPGWTYEDMTAAAKRLLSMRRMYETATGKTVRSNPESTAQVAALLR